ncbi:MAG: LPS-assembly protein LptD [Desulfuromonadales bacterium]|nr:LPS-assembly protein LptD [Desulfuromonadales bacterium]
MNLTRLMIFLACVLFLTASTSFAAEDIIIKADTMNHNEADGTVNANGNVVMEWGGMTLTAQRATYNRSTGMLAAYGNVVINKDGDKLQGEWVNLDMNNGRGEMHKGVASVQNSTIHFTGEKIVRNDDSTLILSETELTTCELPNPSWKFAAEQLNVDLLGYAIGRNIIFYIKDTPVLYIPWIAFPAVREKRTGLLFPKLGQSSKRGFQLDVPLYWVISPSQDATIDVDIETKRGVGLGVDYRYLRKRGSEGNLTGYLIYDYLVDRWRGQVYQSHKEIFSPDMNLRSSINLTTDRAFLVDYGEKSGDYNRQSNDTIINVLKTWQNYALTANLRYSEDYYAINNNHTVQTLPEIGLSAVRQQLYSTPLFFDLDAAASNFYREDGPSGQRLHAFPRLSLVTGLPGYLNATVYAGAHLRGYSTDNIPSGSGIHSTDGNLLPEVGMTLSSSLSRVFDVNGEHLKKLRHELIPEISYRYASDRDQSRLPFYDFDDRLIHQNVVYYGVTSHLGGKFQYGENTEYHDISRIRLMQGYSFDGTRRDQLTMVNDSHQLSDVILETETWLHPLAKLTFDARYDVHDNRISYAAPGVEFEDKQGTTASLSYRMTRNAVTTSNQVEYLEAHLSTKRFKPWTFGYTTRYSFDKGGTLESVYSVEYRHQCWSVNLAVHERSGNPSVSFSFNLAGLTDGGQTRK